MYTKDLTKSIHLRLENDLYEFVKADADNYEMTVSNYIRMLLRATKNLIDAETEKEA